MRQLPHLQELWDRHRGKGLHLFHVESQHHSEEKVSAFLRARGITFPNPVLDWSDFPLTGMNAALGWGYDPARLPKTYIIGVDGKVIWEGRFGYDDVLEKELAKVRYPGLFRQEFCRPLKKAAELYAKGKVGAALNEAERKLESLTDPQQQEDARYILDRGQQALLRLNAGVEEALEAKRPTQALRLLAEIATRFDGNQAGAAAGARKKKLEADSAVKQEVAADAALEKLLDGAGGRSRKDARKLAERLRAFAEQHEGRAAAERALFLAEGFGS